MTDRNNTLARTTSHLSSSSAPQPSDINAVRPRNRRLISTLGDSNDDAGSWSNRGSGLLSAFSPQGSRSTSPLPKARSAGVSPSRQGAANADIGQFLSDSWAQSWSSVQGLTSSLLAGGQNQTKSGWGIQTAFKTSNSQAQAWGPAPIADGTPGLSDVAAGSLQERQAALKAAKTASVLESHEGVNGGLDVKGQHKRRNSDDVTAEPSRKDDYLVYVHHILRNDTFAGIVLRYRCNEDTLRRANGLWSRDSIQTRKWVTIPVDACEVRGRVCEAPSWRNQGQIDHLAATPSLDTDESQQQAPHDEYFSRPINELKNDTNQSNEDDKPWTHVRWIKIDSIQEPVEIGRVTRGAMGYFPPRRKKSIRTISSLSTPRQSIDLSSAAPGSAEGTPSRRLSSMSTRPQLSATPLPSRSRIGSDADDARPAWMRRPGGVGSMGRSVRAPGPEGDYFNTWTRKHIPGLNIESLPSMSMMGSETARIGFSKDSAGLVESPFEEGRDLATSSRQGNGLDRAALAVETWLRGALAKRPATPLMAARGRSGSDNMGDISDLIELTDTHSDDGRFLSEPSHESMQRTTSQGASGRSDGDMGIVRGRSTGGAKGAKAE